MLSLSRVRLFATPWTVARQTPLSMGILQARILEWVAMRSSRGIFPTQGLELGSPALQADSLPAELPRKPRKPLAIWQTSCRRPCGPYTRTPCSARVSWERNSLTSC